MDFWTDPANGDSETSRLVYGTETGNIYIYDFPRKLIVDRGSRKKDAVTDIFMDSINSKPSIYYGNLQKRKSHYDWVMKVRYYHNMKSVVSCSTDPVESLVVETEDTKGRWCTSSAAVPKGVNCFAYCSLPAALVTGGRDRQIRIWNPRNLLSYCTTLPGHAAPINDIKINSISAQIISVGMDKEIRVWDLHNHQCLQTIADAGFHRPDNIISCIKFSPVAGGSLIAASSMLRKYKLREKTSIQENVKSHDFPITNLSYCEEFNLIASGCNGGILNVWVIFVNSNTRTFSLVLKIFDFRLTNVKLLQWHLINQEGEFLPEEEVR